MAEVMKEKLDITLRSLLGIIQDRIMNRSTYFGIKTQKNPLDMWVYQEIIFQTKPDYIIEIGNLYGGSTLALAHMCDLVGKGRVIAIDISHDNLSACVWNHQRVICIEGDAVAVFPKVSRIIPSDSQVMVIEDSSHTFDNTLAILRTYSPLIKPQGLFIVEDSICNHGLPGNGLGPYEAITSFLEENKDFESDRSMESFLVTWNPRGYLRRCQ